MRPATGQKPRRRIRVGQTPHRIGMDSGGVDDHLSLPTLLLTGLRFAHGCGQSSGWIAFESDHPTAAAQGCTALFCGQR